MKAWAKVCTLMVLAFAMAAASGEGAEKKRGICPDGKKACQVGENSYVCVDPDDECPDPDRKKGRGICPDDKKACQVGENSYVCVDPDDECP